MSIHSDLNPPDEAAVESAVPVKTPFPWRLFWLLAGLLILTTLLILPYGIKLAAVGDPSIGQNLPQIIFSSLLQCILIYWPLALLGLLLSRQIGLGAPYLQAISERRPIPPGFKRVSIISAAVGVILGGVILALVGVFNNLLPPELTAIDPSAMPNALEGLMASISAGISEEILWRLFLLSLLAWVIQRLFLRRAAGRPNNAVLWTANILAAVIFGLLHLPNLTTMGISITPMLVVYVILLNGLAGLGFGWLFWTYGLEAAMLAHFFADVVLHVLPRLGG